MKRSLSLGARVAFVIDALILVMAGSLILFIGSRLSSVVESLLMKETMQIVDARGDEIGRLVESHRSELRLLAAQPVLQGKDPKAIEAYVLGLKGAMDSDITNFFMAWPDGRALKPDGSYTEVRERDYFKAVFAEGKEDYIGAPLVSRGTGLPSVIVARGVKGGDGAVKLALCFEMSLDRLTEITATIKLSSSSFGWVVDQAGLVMADPVKDNILKMDITKADEQGGFVGLSALSKTILSADNASGKFFNGADKREYQFFSAMVPNSPGWRLGINISTAEYQAPVSSLRTVLYAILVASAIVAGVVAYFIGLWIARPIKSIDASFKALAEGEADLTSRLEIARGDEIGRMANDFDAFVAKLRDIVASIKGAQAQIQGLGSQLERASGETYQEAERIEGRIGLVREKIDGQARSVEGASEAVGKAAEGIERLDSLIAEQSASIVEASASIEEMVGNIGSVSSSMERIAAEFQSLSSSAELGRTTQSAARERITQIADQSAGLVEANEAIGAIASQTNLLAMNAAIEAAHAGEAGKGFSVVADEIRRLAETAAEQSEAISATMRSIQESIAGIVEASDASESAFSGLHAKVESTDSLVAEVKHAMEEQREGSAQMLQAIRDMNEITAQVKTSSKEMSAGNARVLGEMKSLIESSREIEARAREISEGAAAIRSGAQEASRLAEKNESTVATMEDSVGRFKV